MINEKEYYNANNIDSKKYKNQFVSKILVKLEKIKSTKKTQTYLVPIKSSNIVSMMYLTKLLIIILGNNKVATDVINEMMKTSEGDSKDPKTIHKSGVYYYNKNNAESPVRKIDAIIVTSVSTNGGGYGGFGGTSRWAHVSGLQSKQQISETNPVFYFYFNTNDDMRADWEAGASTPNEFSLVKFRAEKSERLFKVGSSSQNGFSSHSNEGIPEKDKVSFSYDLVSEGIYKVTFNSPLAEGEYCFVFNTNTKRVFDFGVH